jgi:hypothetical protein
MSRSGRWRLQLDDRPPDPLPDGLPFEVAAFELGPKVQTVAHRAACIRSARRADSSSASSPCCRISRLAARQMSRSEIIGIVVNAHSHSLQRLGDRARRRCLACHGRGSAQNLGYRHQRFPRHPISRLVAWWRPLIATPAEFVLRSARVR